MGRCINVKISSQEPKCSLFRDFHFNSLSGCDFVRLKYSKFNVYWGTTPRELTALYIGICQEKRYESIGAEKRTGKMTAELTADEET